MAEVARMRHDLRSPLTVILGLAQVLESEVADEEHKQDLAHIIASGRRLQTLIEEFATLVDAVVGNDDRQEGGAAS